MSIVVGVYTFLTVSIISLLVTHFGGAIVAPIVTIALAAAIISGQIADLKKSLLSQNEDSEKKFEEADNQE